MSGLLAALGLAALGLAALVPAGSGGELTIGDLPAVNAILNATAAILLFIAWRLIRAGRWRAHRNTMLAAVGVSALFLTSYLVYHAHVGSKHFPGTGAPRTLYFAILITHTILAAAVPILAAITLTFAFRKRYTKHRRVARWTLPIWFYVSVTGVIVYWMLYQMSW